MTTPANDYAAAVAALRTQSLPAYVSYTEEASARGLGNGRDAPARLTVDSRTNTIVEKPKDYSSGNTPPTKHVFEPACYAPTTEHLISWNGRNALAINVRRVTPSCADDTTFDVIYADPSTLQLLGADGSENDGGVSVDFSVHYGRFGNYVMPTSLRVHAHGHGLLFWVRERAEVTYSNYDFENVRRQSP